jgi:hypothetical protein
MVQGKDKVPITQGQLPEDIAKYGEVE